MNRNTDKSRTIAIYLSFVYYVVLSILQLAPIPQPTDSMISTSVIHTLLDYDFYSHFFALLIGGMLLASWRIKGSSLLTIAILLAILLEVLQLTTNAREFELTDLFANVIGTFIGVWLAFNSIFKDK